MLTPLRVMIAVYSQNHTKQTKIPKSDTKNSAVSNSEAGSYRDADKSLARPTSRCILFDGENISFDASLLIYI
jgi:hypothetical protein